MAITGFSVLGGVWLVTAITGAAVFDSAGDNFQTSDTEQQERAMGRRLMIPIGGPFAAAFVAPTATGALFSVLSGVAQTVGLGLGVAGAVIYGRNQRQYRLSMGTTPMAGGGRSFHLGLRF